MKTNIEDALARMIGEAVEGLALCSPQYSAGTLPDEGSSLVVAVEIESRGGSAYLVDATLTLQTVNTSTDADNTHADFESAIKEAADSVITLDCGGGLQLLGQAFLVGINGGLDGNRWVTTLTVRYGLLAAL